MRFKALACFLQVAATSSDFLAEKSAVLFGADDIRLYDRVIGERADVYRRFSFGRGFQYISRIEKVCNSIGELYLTARCWQSVFFAKIGKLPLQIIKAAEGVAIQRPTQFWPFVQNR